MPFLASMSLLLMAFGALRFMHEASAGTEMLIGGSIAVILCVFFWWRDVVKEGIHDKAHTSIVRKGLRLGMILFIVSEVMFFFAFFLSFFKASLFPVDMLEDVWPVAAGVWPPEGIETFSPWGLPLLNTAILLLSSVTVHIAHHAVLEDDRETLIDSLLITVILGMIFTALQAYEYHHAAFGFTDGIYASNFYLATGFHGAHVIIGTIFLAVCYLRAKKGQLTSNGHLGLEFASWYWHFVDVVWVFLFIWVYIWGG
jgi:cytochrome c oxidase subunit 3